MADAKISDLTDGGTVAGTDVFPVVRSGANRKVTRVAAHVGTHATAAALETAYPAASNAGATALVSGVNYVSNGTNWRPFDGARMAGDFRALLAEDNVHIAYFSGSGTIVTGAGRLLGVALSRGGSTPTLKLYDNTAASGTVLREAASAELVNGAWVFCGINGQAFSTGIYVQAGGGTSPRGVVIYEGATEPDAMAYPADHANVAYIDGTDGNNANDGTLGSPRKSFHNQDVYDTGNWTIYLKRGTIITIDVSEVQFTGSLTIRPYGDASAAKPIIRQPEGTTNYLKTELITSGTVYVRDVAFDRPTTTQSVTAQWALNTENANTTLKAIDVDVSLFYHAFRACGPFLVYGCTATNIAPTGSLFWGGKLSVASSTSAGLVAKCSITGSHSDSITLHDSTVDVPGTCIVGCTLGGTAAENLIDVLSVFPHTLVLGNTLTGVATQYPVITTNSGAATGGAIGFSFIANYMYENGTYGARVYARCIDTTVAGNFVQVDGVTNATGGWFATVASATNQKLLHNIFRMGNTTTRAGFDLNYSGATGEVKNNLLWWGESAAEFVVRAPADTVPGTTLVGLWQFSGNRYYHALANAWAVGGSAKSFAAWQGTHLMDTTSTATQTATEVYDGTTLKPVVGSPLLAAGQNMPSSGPCYLTLYGPVWPYGKPNIGCAETQWVR